MLSLRARCFATSRTSEPRPGWGLGGVPLPPLELPRALEPFARRRQGGPRSPARCLPLPQPVSAFWGTNWKYRALS